MSIALDTIDIASPCSADWEGMAGDEKSRQCAHCNKTVHNLTLLGRDKAQALLDSDPNRCVRFYRNADGIVWTAGTVPAGAVSRRGWMAAAAALAVGFFARRAKADSQSTDPGSCATPPTTAKPIPSPAVTPVLKVDYAQPKAPEPKVAPTPEPPVPDEPPRFITLDSLIGNRRLTTMKDVLSRASRVEPKMRQHPHGIVMGQMEIIRPTK